MSNRDILAIGTAAGGVEALRFLASEIPGKFPASVLIVIHPSAHCDSAVDSILTRPQECDQAGRSLRGTVGAALRQR